LLVLLSFLLWGMASHALGAIQDIRCDREAGIGSLATVLGARATALVSLTLYLLAACLLISRGGAISLAGVAVLPYSLLALWCLGEDPEVQARQAWRSFLTLNLVVGFFLTQMLLHAFGLDDQPPLVLASVGSLLAVAAMLALEVRGRLVAVTPVKAEQPSSLPVVVGTLAAGGAPGGTWDTAEDAASRAAPDGAASRWRTLNGGPLPHGPAILVLLSPRARALPEAVARLASAAARGRPVAVLADPGGGRRISRVLKPALAQLRWVGLGARIRRSWRGLEGALALAVAVEDCRASLAVASGPREPANPGFDLEGVRFVHCPELTMGRGEGPEGELSGWWQRRLSASPLGPLTSLLVLGVAELAVWFLPLVLLIMSLAAHNLPALLASVGAVVLQQAAAIIAVDGGIDLLLLPIGWAIVLGAQLRAGAREMRGRPARPAPAGLLHSVGGP
ncbi:MAG: UbiA family prenyltransferase, partial [Candidatus Dormibacteria bacterium]